MIYKSFIVICLFFIGCKPEKKEPLILLDYIPQNTIAAFQLKDQNMLKNAITNLPFLEALVKINDSLYSDLNALIPNEFPSNSLLFLTPEGKKNIAASFMYKSTSIDTFPKKIIGRFIYDDVSVIVKEVDNKKIFHATIQNINVLSCSKLVLENSIRNIKSNKRGIQDTQLYKLAGLSDVNTTLSFYLQNEIIGILKDLFPKTDLFPFVASSWFYFDFNTKKNPFTLDGVSFISDSIPDELSLLRNLEAKVLISPNYIPQTFDSYLALAVSDYKTLEDNFKKYSRHKNTPLNKINFDLFSSLDEIAWLKYNSNKAIYLHLNNSENILLDLFIDSINSSKFRGVAIKDQNLPEDFIKFLEAFGMPFKPNYVSKIDDVLIYASNKIFLKQLIGIKLDENTLDNDFNFKSLKKDLADNSTFLWVGNTSNLKNEWKETS